MLLQNGKVKVPKGKKPAQNQPDLNVKGKTFTGLPQTVKKEPAKRINIARVDNWIANIER